MAHVTSVLMLCGSLRRGSVHEAVLRTAAALAPSGCTATLHPPLDALPHFNPDDDAEPLAPAVAALRAAIGAADALLLCTPEYAGALPGTFKNALDWTIGGGEMDRRPVAWINASTGPTDAAGAHASLRAVLGWAGADIVEAAVARVPVPRSAVGEDGLVADPALRAGIGASIAALTSHPAAERFA
jgi:NAD(P)H-dependent FMN reductase